MLDEEPVLIRQTSETEHRENARDWFEQAASDAHAEFGCTFFRYTYEPSPVTGDCPPQALVPPPLALLIEGWVKQPEDQGQPRWSLPAGHSKEPQDDL